MEIYRRLFERFVEHGGHGCRVTLNTPATISVSSDYYGSFETNLRACVVGLEAALGEPLTERWLDYITVERFRATL